jgi:hypothetical protein
MSNNNRTTLNSALERQSTNSLKPILNQVPNQPDQNDTIMVDDIMSIYSSSHQTSSKLKQKPQNSSSTEMLVSTATTIEQSASSNNTLQPFSSMTPSMKIIDHNEKVKRELANEDVYTLKFSTSPLEPVPHSQSTSNSDSYMPFQKQQKNQRYLYNGSINRAAFEIISHADVRPTTPVRYEQVKELNVSNGTLDSNLNNSSNAIIYRNKKQPDKFESNGSYINNQVSNLENSTKMTFALDRRVKSSATVESNRSQSENRLSTRISPINLKYGSVESVKNTGKPVEWEIAREIRTTDWEKLRRDYECETKHTMNGKTYSMLKEYAYDDYGYNDETDGTYLSTKLKDLYKKTLLDNKSELSSNRYEKFSPNSRNSFQNLISTNENNIRKNNENSSTTPTRESTITTSTNVSKSALPMPGINEISTEMNLNSYDGEQSKNVAYYNYKTNSLEINKQIDDNNNRNFYISNSSSIISSSSSKTRMTKKNVNSINHLDSIISSSSSTPSNEKNVNPSISNTVLLNYINDLNHLNYNNSNESIKNIYPTNSIILSDINDNNLSENKHKHDRRSSNRDSSSKSESSLKEIKIKNQNEANGAMSNESFQVQQNIKNLNQNNIRKIDIVYPLSANPSNIIGSDNNENNLNNFQESPPLPPLQFRQKSSNENKSNETNNYSGIVKVINHNSTPSSTHSSRSRSSSVITVIETKDFKRNFKDKPTTNQDNSSFILNNEKNQSEDLRSSHEIDITHEHFITTGSIKDETKNNEAAFKNISFRETIGNFKKLEDVTLSRNQNEPFKQLNEKFLNEADQNSKIQYKDVVREIKNYPSHLRPTSSTDKGYIYDSTIKTKISPINSNQTVSTSMIIQETTNIINESPILPDQLLNVNNTNNEDNNRLSIALSTHSAHLY